ncbi:hypothetical protein CEP54_004447 [Fusarium duplospermum]|uniref:Uncharacterized protein n=1 Tax=Fusarium duplospermum TaxID=1325734 RepID=A0A428QI37_9HYPO|nr:hypothetical protein CEP54_004447 [Fusarium duplospermum]
MGCCMSKPRPSEGEYVGTDLIRLAPPARHPGLRADGSPPRARVVSLPIVNAFSYPPLYELNNTGLPGLSRPTTSAGISVQPIPRIDITHDVIVEQDETATTNPATADKAGDDAAVNATTTTTVEGGDKVVTGTVSTKDAN